ncbi:MAG: hypothetical protein ABI723_05185 [Bacteroidia bacterium]
MEKKMKNPTADPAVAKPKKIQGIKLNDVEPLKQDGGQTAQRMSRKEISKDALIASALPKITDPQAFTASVNAFGKTAVPVNSVVRKNQHDVTLAFAEDNFTFDQVFKDFVSDTNSLFVFDDVRIHLREKQEDGATVNVMRFNGTLRMDNALLSPLKDFLKCDAGLLVNGKMETAGEDITEKISPCNVRLTSAVPFLIPLADGIILKSAALKVELEQVEGKWTFTESIKGTLEINKLGNTPVELDATVTYSDGKLNVVAAIDSITGLFGIEKLALDNLKLEFNVGSENDIELSADFKPANRTFSFDGKISSGFTGIKASSPEFTFNDLSDLFKYFNNDTLALPTFDLTFNDVFIGLATADGTLDSGEIKQGLTIGGSVKVYEHTITTLAQIGKEGVAFTGTLADLKIGPVDITKIELDMNFYSASTGKKSAFSLMGETVIEGLTLDCKVAYEKDRNGVANQLVYAAIHAESFGLSAVFPPAKDTFVDSLKFSKVVFIYSSTDGDTQDPDFEFAVKQGLQLTAVLEEIPALTSLTRSKKTGLILSAHFGNTTDISIEIPDTRLDLGNSVTCDPMRIAIELAPQPALQLIFGLDVTVPKQNDPLHFDLMLEIGVAEGRGSATMKGYWVNPFGVNGLQIGPELALQLGIIYAEFIATGLPSEFGFAGGIKLGDITGKMAVNVSEDPMHEILMGVVAKLSPQNLVAFASTITGLSINAADVPNFFDLEELKLYCAPTGGSIGTVTFEPGFSFFADLILFDKRINIYTLFNDSGVIAKGELDAIELGPLKIGGADGGNAKLDLELTTEKQSVYIDGAFEFLGTGESIYLDISNKGASFELEQKFLNMLKYKFKAQTQGSFSDLPNLDFSFYAEFDNDLTEYIKTTLVQKINDARRAVDVSITDAQKQVDDAQKAYLAEFTPAKAALDKAQKDADAEFARCTKEVSDQKAVWDAKIVKAQTDVANAKATYDNAMNDARNKVNDAQITYNNAVRDAQNTLNNARNDSDYKINAAKADANKAINDYNNSFGKAYSDLNSAQSTVNSLLNQINDYKYRIEHASGWDVFRVPDWSATLAGLYVAYGTATGVLTACQGVVNGFQYSSVAIAKNTAQATLTAAQQAGAAAIYAAQQTVDKVTYGTAYVAFQTAQGTLTALQYGAQYTAWQVANITLSTAQTTGRGLLTAAEYSLTNIGSSVAYVALQGAQYSLVAIQQGTSAVAFDTAKGVLEGAKQGTYGILELSAYIAAHIGDLLEVKQVTLAASLKAIKQGNLFKATFDGSVFTQSYNVTLDFNVNDAAAFIEDLFKKVLDEAKRIASNN